MTDTDTLPPTQYLILEVLAARHRTGETHWTFPSRLRWALLALADTGLIGVKSGVAPRTHQAWLTDAGRAAALMDGYETPVEKAHRAGREDAAEAVWAKATELGGMPFRSGKVGIQYVNGMEDASEIARGDVNNAHV